MQMKYESNLPPASPSPWRKLVAFVATAALVGLVLMVSAVVLVVLFIVGTIAWAYLWWKSRELRKQMRGFQPQAVEPEQKTSDDGVFEGEVIRVVDSQNGR